MPELYGDNIFNEDYNKDNLNKWKEYQKEATERHNEKVKREKRYRAINAVKNCFKEYLNSKNMPERICSIYINNDSRILFVKEDTSYILLEAQIKKSDRASKEKIEAAKKKLKEIMSKVGEIGSYLNSNIPEYHISCNYEDTYCIKVNIH